MWDKQEKVGAEKATWNEYVATIYRMTKVVEVPASWRVPIMEHIHQLATMATEWGWETCRLWLECVFMMIDEGCLLQAWTDKYAIKDLQSDAFAVRLRAGIRSQHPSYNVNRKAATAMPPHSNVATGTCPGMYESQQD